MLVFVAKNLDKVNFFTMEISCSIIMVNWKSIDYLTQCIKSIETQTMCSYEIIVIDNDSGEEEQAKLQKIKNICLILNKKNVGFAAANNQGFKIARGEYIFMLNPDTCLLNNAIDVLISYLDKNYCIYAAAPKLFYSKARDYHPSIKRFHTPLNLFLNMLPLAGYIKSIFSKITLEADKTIPVQCVWGAAILFKREVFQKIGFLDERFFLYTEEVDFCRRMYDKGLKLYYHPKAEVIHYGGKSQNKSSHKKSILIWESMTKYFEKYYSKRHITICYSIITVLLKIKFLITGKIEQNIIYEYLKDYLDKIDHEKYPRFPRKVL